MAHRSPCVRLAMAALLVAGCARSPGGESEVAFSSSEREAQVGAEMAAEVEASMGMLDAPALEAYVAGVGARLAVFAPRRDVAYRVGVIDVPEPNAFALPGGYVFVSRGLLQLANSEDELANVLGHEIAHLGARHAMQRQTRSVPVGIRSSLGSLAGGAVPGDELGRAIGALPQLTGALILARYSRDQEREADEVGQQLAARAGWDPEGMPAFFESLQQLEALEPADPDSPVPSFFASHPDIPERIEDARKRAEQLDRGPGPTATREEFLAHLDGLPLGPDPSEGVFRGPLFLHPDLAFAMRFPEGWTTANSLQVVSALSPERDGLLILKLQQEGDDPHAAAVSFARGGGLTLTRLKRVEVNGLPAVRGIAGVRSGTTTFVADYTFIAHAGFVFRITGATALASYAPNASQFADAARSFRRLEPDERVGFRSRRLRLARAQPGEDFAAFSARTGNVWSPDEFDLANGREPGAPLGGELFKLARDEPFRPVEARAESSR